MIVSLVAWLVACSNDLNGKIEDPTLDTGSDAPLTDSDNDGSPDAADCDDADPDTYPGAEELCDGVDNDCDGRDDADTDRDGEPDCSDTCPVFARPGVSGTGTMSSPFNTLQQAIDLAGQTNCNEVRAFAGTYAENVDWHGYPVNAESVKGAEETIIDGGGVASTVTFGTGETSGARISGFTVTNGAGSGTDSESPSVTGGGITIRGASPRIENNVITGNTSDYGGGILVADGSPAISNTTVSDNAAARGAGIYAARDVMDLHDCTLEDNDASYAGGGLYLLSSDAVVEDTVIQRNTAAYGGPEEGSDGGGIAIVSGAPEIRGCDVLDNEAGDGGGIWTARSDALIYDNLVRGNRADDVPATGEYHKDGQGGGINVQNSGTGNGTRVVRNLILDNEASLIGGGVCVYEAGPSGSQATIVVNNTLVGNVVSGVSNAGTTHAWGAGIGRYMSAPAEIQNNLVVGSAVLGTAAGLYSFDGTEAGGTIRNLTYNLVWGYGNGFSPATLASSTGTLAVDPDFVDFRDDNDWTNDTFTLAAGSAAVNAGNPDAAFNDNNGSRNDLGHTGGPLY
ncbi:MAG: hypothetical protein RLZZ299_819 [Pseudomonadota bacterium]|jgi:hypothetical protein